MKKPILNIALFIAFLKDYSLIAFVAAGIIAGSYFVIFSSPSEEKSTPAEETAVQRESDTNSSASEGQTASGSGNIYLPWNKDELGKGKFNMDTKVDKKDFKDPNLGKGVYGKTDIKGGANEGSASDIKGGKINTAMAEAGSLSGRVLLEESFFHEGTTVILTRNSVEIPAKTNEKGEFSFAMIPTGTYKLLAKAEEYYPVTKEGVSVGKNSNIKLGDIVLKPNFDVAYPRITRSKPERGAVDVQVPNNFGISGLEAGNTNLFVVFDFSKPMEKDTVEKAIVILPYMRHSFSWIGVRRLVMKCDTAADENPLKPDTQYKIEFKESAVAIDGKKLVKHEPFVFTTGGLKFMGSSPAGGKLHPPSDKSLQFYFNFPVDKTAVTAANFVLAPAIKGRLALRDNKDNQINFTADKFFPTDTNFTVTLKKDIKARGGETLGTDVAVKFATEPLKVMTTWPKDDEKNILTSGFPYVFFNSNVKKESVEKAISIKPEITAELVWKIDDTNIEYCILKHKPYFNVSTDYVINISDDVTDLYDKKLKEPHKFRFKTESCRVSYMQPPEGSMNVEPKAEIKIIFNTIMNHQETEKYVSIEPKKDVVFLWSSPDNYDILNIEAKNGWEPHTSYVFRVAKAAKGKNGESLVKDFKGVIYIK